VYYKYKAMTSMSTAAVFKFAPAFTWPSAWPVVVSWQYVYEIKFNKRRTQWWLQIDRSLL